jgi:hypothetical protein
VQEIRAVAGFALTGDAAADIDPWFPVDRTETRRMSLSRPLPIYIDYWTVFRDVDGTVAFRPDVYGRDSLLLQKLGVTDAALQRSVTDSRGKRKHTAAQKDAAGDAKSSLAWIDAVASEAGFRGLAHKRLFDLRHFFSARR